MGASSSQNGRGKYPGQLTRQKSALQETITRHFLPTYHTEELPSKDELGLAFESWQSVVKGNRSISSSNLSEMDGKVSVRTIELFRMTFFDRLFELHPRSRTYFADKEFQVRWLIKLIGVIFDNVEDPYCFENAMKQMTMVHAKMGYTVVEFGLIGDALFYSFSFVLEDKFSYESNQAWVKIMSWVLRIMVPLNMEFESDPNHGNIEDKSPMFVEFRHYIRKKPKLGKVRSLMNNLMASNVIYASSSDSDSVSTYSQ